MFRQSFLFVLFLASQYKFVPQNVCRVRNHQQAAESSLHNTMEGVNP